MVNVGTIYAAKQVSHHSQRMGGVNAVALSGDETTVLTMGQEKRITYWDLREHHPILAKVRGRHKRNDIVSSSERSVNDVEVNFRVHEHHQHLGGMVERHSSWVHSGPDFELK